MEAEREQREKEIEGYRQGREILLEERENHKSETREFEKTINGHYKMIEKVHKQLDMANVPSGGNILDRLQFLVEQFLIYRRHVPRIVLMDQDNDE
jgi:hypothetical protein